MNETETKKILSRKDVQELLGVSSVTIWNWVKLGLLREYSFSRKRYYIYDEVIEDVKKMAANH